MDLDRLENGPTTLSSKPVGAEFAWNRLPKRFMVRKGLGVVLSTIFVGLPAMVGLGWIVEWSYSVDRSLMIKLIGALWFVFLCVRVIASTVEVAQRQFALRQLDIVYQQGLLNRRELVISFSRIHEVSTSSKILDRTFLLSSLNLFLADDDETIEGLDVNVAARIRDYIADRVVHISSSWSGSEATSGLGIHQSNALVAVDSLPDAHDPTWSRFNCLARELVGRIASVVLLIPILLALLMAIIGTLWRDILDLPLTLIFLSLWLLLAARSLLYPILEIPRRGYALREFDLVKTAGLVAKTRVAVPLTRVQHLATSSGFIDRRFGLATLAINTAGTGVSLGGLRESDAEDLRARILRRSEELGVEMVREAEDVAPDSTGNPS